MSSEPIDWEDWQQISDGTQWNAYSTLLRENERLRTERADLLRMLHCEFEVNNPDLPEPDWITVAASLREAAEGKGTTIVTALAAESAGGES